MFTLKLFKRINGLLTTLVVAVHHVETLEVTPKLIEIRAYRSAAGGDYDDYYVGERKSGHTALNNYNHWGWGLLENWEGNTSEHYRPHSFG